MFRHLLRDDGIQEVPKHVVDCVTYCFHTYSLFSIFSQKSCRSRGNVKNYGIATQATDADVIRSMHAG